jgi:hypothetical protein
VRRQEVPSVCRSVSLADHDMRVHARFGVLARDAAGERQRLDLLLDRDPRVVLPLGVEEATASASRLCSSTRGL